MFSFRKLGIHEIECNNCNAKYVGQFHRAIKHGSKNTFLTLNTSMDEKSSDAQHVLEQDPFIDLNTLKLIKEVTSIIDLTHAKV